MNNKMPFPAVHGMENLFSYNTFPEMASAYPNVLLSITIIISNKKEIKQDALKKNFRFSQICYILKKNNDHKCMQIYCKYVCMCKDPPEFAIRKLPTSLPANLITNN